MRPGLRPNRRRATSHSHRDCVVELAVGLGRERGAGEHAVGAGDEHRLGALVLVDARDRRDVAEDPEILGQRVFDRGGARPNGADRTTSRPAPRDDAGQRDEHGTAPPRETKRPSNASDGLGILATRVRAPRLGARGRRRDDRRDTRRRSMTS